MSGKERDLEGHLEGLFDDLTAPKPPETGEEAPLSLDEAVADLLERAPEAAEPTESAAAFVEKPPLALPTEEPVEEPPAAEPLIGLEERLRRQRRRVLDIMLTVMSVIGGAIILSIFIAVLKGENPLYPYIPYFVVYSILLVLTLKKDLGDDVRAGGIIGLAYLIGLLSLWEEGPLSAGGLYLLGGSVLAASLLGVRAGWLAALIGSLFYGGFLLADHLSLLNPPIPYNPSLLSLVIAQGVTFVLVSVGTLFPQVMLYRTMLDTMKDVEEEHRILADTRAVFEARANELGRANALLQRRTLQLRTVAEISGVAAFSVVNLDELLHRVVTLIRDRFGLHYVALFLTVPVEGDEGREEWAELQADAGPAARRPSGKRYRIRIDPSSAVGRCILNIRAYISGGHQLRLSVTDESGQERPYTLSTGSRSEIALPLRSRGRVLGALTLQSDEQDAFSPDDVPILQTMADQIGVAIDNARLFDETQERLRETEEIQRRYGRERWADLVPAHVPPLYERRQEDIPPLGDTVPPEVRMALERGALVTYPGNGSPAALVAPISLRDEIIGALGLHDASGRRVWSEDEIALVEAVADQMALAIENARLLDETRRRAERERLTADITAQVRASTEVDSILRTAIRELGRALRASEGVIQLAVDDRNAEQH